MSDDDLDRPWVELRIHGVSGTPPEVMLDCARVEQVAGDSWGRFLRPVNGVGEPLQSEPGRLLEGYHWGRYTSGSWIKGLWLVLVPCGLVNAADLEDAGEQAHHGNHRPARLAAGVRVVRMRAVKRDAWPREVEVPGRAQQEAGRVGE